MKATVRTAANWAALGAAALFFACGTPAQAPAANGASQAAAPDARALFARFQSATGGARWSAITSLESKGTLSAGGLSGPIASLQDATTGRSVVRYSLGHVEGAEGFDGTTPWQKDAGGEVSALDAPDAREAARTEAWMASLGYFFPSRAPAALSAVREVREGEAGLFAVDATPAGGRAITLFFDRATSLLVRTVTTHGGDTITTSLDDYREVDGVRVPFHVVTDRKDSAGRTDPRARTEVRFEHVAVNVAIADGAFAMPAMQKNATIADSSGSTRVPFDLVNNHIYADVTVDGARLRVIVDTGGVNLLTPATAKRLGVATEGKLQGRGVGDEHVDVALARAGEVRLGGAALANPIFYVMDLGPIAEVEGTDIDGLVGFEMFRRFRVTVDYAARALTLTLPEKFTPPSGAHAVPFELAERIPIVRGALDGLPVRLSVDTGSRASLSMHSPFVRDHELVARYGAADESVVGWGVGGPLRGRPARLGTLTLGDVSVNDIAGDLYLGDKGALASPELSGNLGAGVLRRFTVTFDYDAKIMYLAPNAELAKADDFDRSGTWLLKDGDALKVAAVAPHGAAEKAGMKEGDRIVKIGGEPASARSLNDWRVRLRELAAGTKLSVTVARSAGQAQLTLVLADRIPPHARASR